MKIVQQVIETDYGFFVCTSEEFAELSISKENGDIMLFIDGILLSIGIDICGFKIELRGQKAYVTCLGKKHFLGLCSDETKKELVKMNKKIKAFFSKK